MFGKNGNEKIATLNADDGSSQSNWDVLRFASSIGPYSPTQCVCLMVFYFSLNTVTGIAIANHWFCSQNCGKKQERFAWQMAACPIGITTSLRPRKCSDNFTWEKNWMVDKFLLLFSPDFDANCYISSSITMRRESKTYDKRIKILNSNDTNHKNSVFLWINSTLRDHRIQFLTMLNFC